MKKFLVACFCGTFAAVAFGKTIYVSPEGAGNKDGSSPENAATLALLRSNFGSWFVTGEENIVQLLDSDTPYSVPNESPVFDFNNGNTKYVVFQGNVEDPLKVVLDMSTDTMGGRGYVVRAPGKLRGITFKNFTQKDSSYPGVICAFVAFSSGAFCVENCRFENCVSTATSGEQCSGTVVRYYNSNAANSTSNLIMSNCVFTSCSAYNRGIIWKGYEGGKMELVGCTFTNCTTSTGCGSVIFWNATGSDTCNLSLKNCRILDVHGTGTLGTSESGAIDLYKGKLSLEDCEFNTVSNSYNGGCVYVYETASNLSVERCAFRKCTAINGGGAIYVKSNSGTTVSVRDSFFSECGLDKNGGALYLNNSAEVIGCVFTNCVASGASGGAIYAGSDASLVTVSNSTFISCSAKTGGAIDCAQNSKTYNIFNCKFLANTASEYPAAINANCGNNSSVSLFVRNCLFVGNSVSDTSGNGAIDIRGKGSDVSSIDNCTFVGGRAPNASKCHPIVLCSGKFAVKNCIFWDNLYKDKLAAVTRSGGDIAVANCATDVAISESGITVTDPVSLTASPFKDAANGDYTLPKKVGGAPNPCLGAGIKLDWMTKDSKDLAGNPRLRGDDIVDLGCYEYFQKSGLYLILR